MSRDMRYVWVAIERCTRSIFLWNAPVSTPRSAVRFPITAIFLLPPPPAAVFRCQLARLAFNTVAKRLAYRSKRFLCSFVERPTREPSDRHLLEPNSIR